jgi:hypothetical protein
MEAAGDPGAATEGAGMTRVACPFCRREVALTGAGRFRHHNHPLLTRQLCWGSARTPDEAEKAAAQPRVAYGAGPGFN